MRLGASESITKPDTAIRRAYGNEHIQERHRHRYEVANSIRPDLDKAGLIISATTPDGSLVEACEWPGHPWGLGVQFHPEFKSRPTKAHPIFKAFVAECITFAKERQNR
jgi:CTP synthase